MRKEKAIDPKELFQAARRAEYDKEQIEKSLARGETNVTLADLAEAEARFNEKLDALKILPPPPVLPPAGQLQKITGRLESFSRVRCLAHFEPDSYTTHPSNKMSAGDRAGIGAAAIALGSPALAGLAIRDEEPLASEADYIKGTVNGKPFAGWVGLTHLHEGDEVELAAEWQEDHYQVYAVAVPAQRVVSVCPRADHGRYIQALSKIKWIIYFLLFLLVFLHSVHLSQLSGGFWDNLFNGLLYNAHYFYFSTALIIGLGSLLLGLFFYSLYLGHKKTTCALAENIFRAYGWKNPKSISLQSVTAKKEKALKRSGEWYSPHVTNQPPKPSTKEFCDVEYWYYY